MFPKINPTEIMDSFISKWKSPNVDIQRLIMDSTTSTSEYVTLIPFLQMGVYGVRQEETIFKEIFDFIHSQNDGKWKLWISSPYLNFDPTLVKKMFNGEQAFTLNVLTCSPKV